MPSIQWDDEAPAVTPQGSRIIWDDTPPMRRSPLPPAQEETFLDRQALTLDKVLKSMGEAVPSYLPTRQDFLDIFGGMAGMGGLLGDAPRIRNTTTDSGYKTLGKVLDPTMLAVGGKTFQAVREAPAIAQMGSNLAKNMIAGSAAGGAVGSFNGEPLVGAATGAILPTAVSALGKVVRPVAQRVGEMFDAAVIPGGATRAAGRVATDVAKGDAAQVAQALQQGVSAETAAQAAAPVGRAEFSGLERIIGNREPSTFGPAGTVSQGRAATERQAWQDLKALTDGERDTVLAAANQGASGVPLTVLPILQSIQQVAQAPGFRSNPAVRSVMEKYSSELMNVADPATGAVNANDLYTIRKTMGNMVESLAAKEGWDKKLTRGLVTGIQKEIDFAIERSSGMIGPSGGSRWEDYLNAFKGGAKQIEAFGERGQQAKLQGAAGAPEARRISRIDEVPLTLPNILSRPAMLANAFVRMMSGHGGEKTTNELARLMAPEGKAELGKLMEAELARRLARGQNDSTTAMLQSILAGRMAGEQ